MVILAVVEPDLVLMLLLAVGTVLMATGGFIVDNFDCAEVVLLLMDDVADTPDTVLVLADGLGDIGVGSVIFFAHPMDKKPITDTLSSSFR